MYYLLNVHLENQSYSIGLLWQIGIGNLEKNTDHCNVFIGLYDDNNNVAEESKVFFLLVCFELVCIQTITHADV